MEELKKHGDYENIMCIYKIENKVTGKVYIGSTNNLRRRLNSHIYELKNNTHSNPELQNSWNKLNKDKFFFDIVEIIDDESFLPIAEFYYIEKHRRINGVYNVSNPLDEILVINAREKKNLSLSSEKVPQKDKSKFNKKLSQLIMSEFNSIFLSLKNKIEKDIYIEFSKLKDYIITNISIKGFDNKDIENNIIRALKKYNLSVYNFESHMYPREILNNYGIYIYKRSIINKEFGKLITGEIQNS